MKIEINLECSLLMSDREFAEIELTFAELPIDVLGKNISSILKRATGQQIDNLIPFDLTLVDDGKASIRCILQRGA